MTRYIGTAVTLDVSRPCPECGGAYMDGHADSIIMFDHTGDCAARAHMDGQNVADLMAHDHRFGGYKRLVTETELELLAAVGIPAGPKSIAHLVERHSYRYDIVVDD